MINAINQNNLVSRIEYSPSKSSQYILTLQMRRKTLSIQSITQSNLHCIYRNFDLHNSEKYLLGRRKNQQLFGQL